MASISLLQQRRYGASFPLRPLPASFQCVITAFAVSTGAMLISHARGRIRNSGDFYIAPQRQLSAEAFLSRERERRCGDSQVPGGNSVGFEKGDLGVVRSTGNFAIDYVGKWFYG